MTTKSESLHLTEGQVLTDLPLSWSQAALMNASGMVVATPGESGWRVATQP